MEVVLVSWRMDVFLVTCIIIVLIIWENTRVKKSSKDDVSGYKRSGREKNWWNYENEDMFKRGVNIETIG